MSASTGWPGSGIARGRTARGWCGSIRRGLAMLLDADSGLLERVVNAAYTGVVLYPDNAATLAPVLPARFLRVFHADEVGGPRPALGLAGRGPESWWPVRTSRCSGKLRAGGAGDVLPGLRGRGRASSRRLGGAPARLLDGAVPDSDEHSAGASDCHVAGDADLAGEGDRRGGRGRRDRHAGGDGGRGGRGGVFAAGPGAPKGAGGLPRAASSAGAGGDCAGGGDGGGVRPSGWGCRSCIDTTTLFWRQRASVGSTSQGALLCCPEVFCAAWSCGRFA